jgi:hypothetical protein
MDSDLVGSRDGDSGRLDAVPADLQSKDIDNDRSSMVAESLVNAPQPQASADSLGTVAETSLAQSEGFITERESVWKLLQFRQHSRMRAQDDVLQRCPVTTEKKELSCIPRCEAARKTPEKCLGNIFWQIYYEPSFICLAEERIGAIGDGGTWVCDPHRIQHRIAEGERCLVYSIGGCTYDFEAAVHSQISSSCQIYNLVSSDWRTSACEKGQPPAFVNSHVSSQASLPAVVEQLGHRKRVIDILRIDCAKCEWTTFKSWFGDGVFIRQLLVKLHYTSGDGNAIIHEFFKFLFDLGYVVFHKEAEYIKCGGRCIEYGFVRMSSQFSRFNTDTLFPSSSPPFLTDRNSLSMRQSEGFIDEPDAVWKLQQKRQQHRMRLQKEIFEQCPTSKASGKERACIPACVEDKRSAQCTGNVFWQVHYEPSFSCLHERRVGMEGEGGKWVCDPHKLRDQVKSGKACLVYSIGSHGQYDFEQSVHDQISPSCEIHTMDMKNWDKYKGGAPPKFVNFHVIQVGARPPATNVPQIVERLGHQKRTIDLFKIDCEGCEWSTFKAWFGEGVYIRQILVELHWEDWDKGKRKSIQQMEVMHEFFNFLFSLGYVIFHKEPNILGCKGHCLEYSFVKMSPEFTAIA